jgi:putative nucleotidyltransferase with HDIG domain
MSHPGCPEHLLPAYAPDVAPAATLHLSEVIGALSYALDLTEGQPPGHSLRCCAIGMRVGAALGLDTDALSDLYYTLLLKDTGCSSNAGRLWQLYGGDERLVKHDYKTVDSQSLLQLAQFVLTHSGPGEALKARLKRVLSLSASGEHLATELTQTRCERGANIVRRLGFSERVAAGVYSLDEHWNGKGQPEARVGGAIPLFSRIALLAQVVDVFQAVGGPAAAMAEVRKRTGTWFDPTVAGAFLDAADATLWSAQATDGLDARVAAMEPAAHVIMVDENRLDVIAEAFSDVVDAKSAYTYGHSQRVARYAEASAARMGFGAQQRRWLRRGALLHDIGKLGVSNGILDKPGRLDADEWDAVRRHAAYSEAILSRISVFNHLAPIAAAHHERMDGKGYPKQLSGDAISLETRIITVADIFDAITAARPYRGAIPVPETIVIMEKERDTAIDGRCLDALIACLPELDCAQP